MTLNGLKSIIKRPWNIIYGLSWRGMLDWMSDEAHFKLFYREYMGKRLKLDPPRSFNEKIVWLSLHDRRPEYTIILDLQVL